MEERWARGLVRVGTTGDGGHTPSSCPRSACMCDDVFFAVPYDLLGTTKNQVWWMITFQILVLLLFSYF